MVKDAEAFLADKIWAHVRGPVGGTFGPDQKNFLNGWMQWQKEKEWLDLGMTEVDNEL